MRKKDTTVGDNDQFWQSSTSYSTQTKRTYTHTLELDQIVTPEEMATNMVDNTSHSNCPCNYSGSSGAMESDGMLYLMKRMHTVMHGKIYYEWIVSDDDNKMKKYLTHPQTRPTGKKHIGGRLHIIIPKPKWFADPTHRSKCVAGAFFYLVKVNKKMTKLDALRLKNTIPILLKRIEQKRWSTYRSMP